MAQREKNSSEYDMNFFQKIYKKFFHPKENYTEGFRGEDGSILTIDNNSTGLKGNNGTLTVSNSAGTWSVAGTNLVGNSNLLNSANFPAGISVSIDSSAIHVSLDDLVQYGRKGYMVKIMNLSVEDRKWLRDQLDTESVDLI